MKFTPQKDFYIEMIQLQKLSFLLLVLVLLELAIIKSPKIFDKKEIDF